MELAEMHRRTVEAWRTRVVSVGDGWGRLTPCQEWDVRALVNHVVGEDRWTRPIVEGATVEEVGDRFDGDLLGDDPVAAALDASADAVAAVQERLPDGGTVHLSFGEVPMEEYVWQVSTDHLVHAWDLAAATGQDRKLDPEVVDTVAAWFAEREQMYRDSGVIGPRLESADDPQSRLLGAFGRDPSW